MAAVAPLDHPLAAAQLDVSADEAAARLYERHAQRVARYCLHWLRSREEAEDATQTTFLYALRALRRGVVPVNETAWLLSIARNVCLSHSQAAHRRRVEVTRDPHVLDGEPGAPAADREDIRELTEALESLTEQQRRAVLLREWQGLSYREIAAELSLSQAAVETLLFRARHALSDRVRGKGVRKRSRAGLGSFVPWLKSFAGGGGAAKLIAATAIAGATTAVGLTVERTARPDAPPVPARTAKPHLAPPFFAAPSGWSGSTARSVARRSTAHARAQLAARAPSAETVTRRRTAETGESRAEIVASRPQESPGVTIPTTSTKPVAAPTVTGAAAEGATTRATNAVAASSGNGVGSASPAAGDTAAGSAIETTSAAADSAVATATQALATVVDAGSNAVGSAAPTVGSAADAGTSAPGVVTQTAGTVVDTTSSIAGGAPAAPAPTPPAPPTVSIP
jgi:RNA polymerase sigma-70 factor (ECF subfamily)